MNHPLKRPLILLAVLCAPSCALPDRAQAEPVPPMMTDATKRLQAQMLDRWSSPERRTWRIVYRSIDGMEGEENWHIEGTQYWVRIYPEVYHLEELNKESVYEIDAIALNQNYGVIDFYIYQFPREIQEGAR